MISEEDNQHLEQLINNILNNKQENQNNKEEIDKKIYKIYNLSDDEVKHITEVVNGKIDKN